MMLDLSLFGCVPCFCLKVQKILHADLPAASFPSRGVFPTSVPPASLCLSDPWHAQTHQRVRLPPGRDKPRSSALPLAACDSHFQHNVTGGEKMNYSWIIFPCEVEIFRSLQLATCSEGLHA